MFLYLVALALLALGLTWLEISSPGALRLQVFTDHSPVLGTSEFSLVESLQLVFLACCGAFALWTAHHCKVQRPLAVLLGTIVIVFFVRELDYFLDVFVTDHFWQVCQVIVIALSTAYLYRHWRALQVAWLRAWPSPGISMMFGAAMMLVVFARLVAHEPFWQALLGDGYLRIAKIGAEEFMELFGYWLWLTGMLEYTLESRARLRLRETGAADRRRRERRGRTNTRNAV
jgi:hypothetical protein